MLLILIKRRKRSTGCNIKQIEHRHRLGAATPAARRKHRRPEAQGPACDADGKPSAGTIASTALCRRSSWLARLT